MNRMLRRTEKPVVSPYTTFDRSMLGHEESTRQMPVHVCNVFQLPPPPPPQLQAREQIITLIISIVGRGLGRSRDLVIAGRISTAS